MKSPDALTLSNEIEKLINDYAYEFAKAYIKVAVDLSAYLHVTYHIDQSTDPLDMEFFWDEEGFGKIAKGNLREEYLEIFNDDPEHYAPYMPAVIASLRNLADEIEAIYAATTK